MLHQKVTAELPTEIGVGRGVTEVDLIRLGFCREVLAVRILDFGPPRSAPNLLANNDMNPPRRG
jgi:hypothetical protein